VILAVYLALADMAASIPHFVSLEVLNLIQPLSRFGPVAASWLRAVITMLGMEMVVYVAMKALWAVKPRTSANKHAAGKPLGPVVAVRGAVVRRNVIVAIGALGRHSNVDAHLSLCVGTGNRETDNRRSSPPKPFQSIDPIDSIIRAVIGGRPRSYSL
jgi:hypothetical protein